jgi:hypothetical protein
LIFVIGPDCRNHLAAGKIRGTALPSVVYPIVF